MGSRHQTGVDAVEARQLSSTQEVSHCTVGWKVVPTIFWDCKGMLLVDYLPQKTIMTGPYHTHTYTHSRFTALLEFVRDHPGEQVPER